MTKTKLYAGESVIGERVMLDGRGYKIIAIHKEFWLVIPNNGLVPANVFAIPAPPRLSGEELGHWLSREGDDT